MSDDTVSSPPVLFTAKLLNLPLPSPEISWFPVPFKTILPAAPEGLIWVPLLIMLPATFTILVLSRSADSVPISKSFLTLNMLAVPAKFNSEPLIIDILYNPLVIVPEFENVCTPEPLKMVLFVKGVYVVPLLMIKSFPTITSTLLSPEFKTA